MGARNWVNLLRDANTGIETLHAHFEGHAYDPHWHDSYLVGFTEHGVQQFHCRGERHVSTPGKVFLLEPGDIHDGEAPTGTGFTYRTLYVDPHWLQRELRLLSEDAPTNAQPGLARHLLAQGNTPAQVAAALSFADQSHLGRWFLRAYGMTP